MKALQHEFPYWSDDTDEGRVSDGPLYVWPGRPRYVSARRARKLRKRGVPLLPLHAVRDRSGGQHAPGHFEPTTPGRGPGTRNARYAWFEPETVAENRRARRGAACYQTWLEAERGLRGRKADLQERLAYQRERLQRRRYHTIATTCFVFPIPSILQREDETDQQFVRRHLAGQGAQPHNLPRATYMLSEATPEQLDAAARVDMSDFREGLRYAKYDTPSCPGCVACPHDGVHPSEGVA